MYTLWKDAQAQGADWAETFSFFRLLGYITLRAGLAATIAFSLSLFLGGRVIRKLISLKVGQPIRTAEEVHKLAELHGGKAGTPTMGGIMILGTVFLAVLLCADMTNPFVLVTLVVTLALGILGFLDDYKKIVEKSSDGVSGKLKLVWQGVVGLGAALFLCYNPQTSEYLFYSGGEVTEPTTVKVTSVSFPLLTFVIPLGLLAIPFFMALLVGTSNAVNLTDGLDGLATGVTVTVAMAYAIICYLSGTKPAAEYLNIFFNPHLAELSILMMALVGAGLGFLWFNCHPAKVFMGDTGSLAIGGAIGMTAICAKQELLLVIIGGVFVMEAMSVILQVGSFKLRGKRIFAMSPIHHHFELRGWHENQVIIRFWVLSILLSLFGIALLKVI
ncbi:phospho-N-acetylmuramoyl-pentapeptide-transferase [bacterium]|nr:phospho-N-acetylmuramoyl-pentapeptide-transferase [bacterium]MDB4317481.1 phospho-N-acetylmuramoyl-pentapeptide-transferase [bacterium]MDB4462056.1 phospho-N-acetylmuramoyl-pentapeptide-transferase [bacterium]MDB4769644.1 phospho-N-acetylmuramoyl-pentapeptide-transferase [bacterium]